MSDQDKENCCPSVEVRADGGFKVSGPREFVEEKYIELKNASEERRRKLLKTRCRIAFVLLVAGTLGVAPLPLAFSFPGKDYLVIFGAGLIGLSFRAAFLGKDIRKDKTVKDLWIAYLVLYPLIIGVFSVLILSVLKQLGYEEWRFYGAALPTTFFAGTLGLDILGKRLPF